MWIHRLVIVLIAALYMFTSTAVAHGQTTDVEQQAGGGQPNPTFATDRGITLLPNVNPEIFKTNRDCYLFAKSFENAYFFGSTKGDMSQSLGKAFDTWLTAINQTNATDPRLGLKSELALDDILACALISGRVKFAYVPFYATYVLQLGMILSGVIAMFFVIIGGYSYTFSGLTDDKETGRNTIKYAIIGLVVSAFSWIIVELVQIAASGGLA